MKDLAQFINNKTLLYIHGLGSNGNSQTAQVLKEYLGDNFTLLTPTWNLTDPEQCYNNINKYIAKNNVHVVIASSLGAFYALGITDSVAKILINPCMVPSVEVPRLVELSITVIQQFEQLEYKIYGDIDAETRACTFAIFGDNDELFNYQNKYKRLYGPNSVIVPGGHRLHKSSLYKGIGQSLSYFGHFQQHMFGDLI